MSIEEAIIRDYVAAVKHAGLSLFTAEPMGNVPEVFSVLDYIEFERPNGCVSDGEVLLNVYSRSQSIADVLKAADIISTTLLAERPETETEKVIFARAGKQRYARNTDPDGHTWHQKTIIIQIKITTCGTGR